MLDLHAEIPGLAPGDGSFEALATHPGEQGQQAAGAGLAGGHQRDQRISEVEDVSRRLLGVTAASDGEIREADDPVGVEENVAEAERGGGLVESFVLEVGLGNPPQDEGEAGGGK